MYEVELESPFEETWPPDESHRPLDDEELEASRRDPAPTADDLVDRRYAEAWLALTRLHASGALPKDALDRLVEMQAGARKLAGGRTTPDMLEQMKRWLTSYEHKATGSPLDREVER